MLWNESRNSLTLQCFAEYFFIAAELYPSTVHQLSHLQFSEIVSGRESSFHAVTKSLYLTTHHPAFLPSHQPLPLWTHSYNCIYATTRSNLVDTDTEGLSVKRGLSVVLFVENKNLLSWSIGFIMFKIAKHSDVSLVPHDPFSHPQKPLGISSKPIS